MSKPIKIYPALLDPNISPKEFINKKNQNSAKPIPVQENYPFKTIVHYLKNPIATILSTMALFFIAVLTELTPHSEIKSPEKLDNKSTS